MGSSIRRSTLILTGSMILIILLYVLAYWLPQNRNIMRMQAEIQRKRDEVSLQEKHSSQLSMLYGELSQLDTYNQQMTERIPSVLNVKEFVVAVHSLGQKEGVTISNVTPRLVTELVGAQQQSVSLTLLGKYHAIVQVLHELETMERLIELSDLEVRRATKSADSEDALEVKVGARLFARPAKSPLLSKNND